tara:strand:+ start:2867 stop:3085 length:219 start_codon:yes stop_codon:yes gene_type:complete
MREHNPETVIRTLKYLLDGSNDVLSSNAVSSTHGCLYYDVHNSLIDAVSLLGGDVDKYEYVDPENPDIEGRN